MRSDSCRVKILNMKVSFLLLLFHNSWIHLSYSLQKLDLKVVIIVFVDKQLASWMSTDDRWPAFQEEWKITFIFLVKRMKSTRYSMEYCYRLPWISHKFNNDSSHNWILTKLNDHSVIPISYFNALLGGRLARIERLIHFGCVLMDCVI